MIKMATGLLTYKIKNRKYYNDDLSAYPDGQKKMYDSLSFLGDLRDMVWSLWMMMVAFF